MDQLSHYVLGKTLKYLYRWNDIEKLENINNKLNYLLFYIYSRTGLNFKCYEFNISLKKLTKKFSINKLYLENNTNITNEGLKWLQGVHTLNL